ncbi:hypothetical protein EXIGLDRAFT_778412 [Exidia glandulosa HHB12029]|uniref:Uncharacterized protein n=1 Tax=Exidia glandulosa HHB12029 TaxID=1314781 RepID=A0A165CJG0_EXIGL|nr:hypothetical protein EXIGLDRAFT_778412 [Exidia glandulosa HHB12029]
MSEPHFLNVLNLDESGRRELLNKLDAWRGTAQPKAMVGTTLELGARYINADRQGDERPDSARRSDFIQCRQQNCGHFAWPPTRPVPPSFTQCHTAVRIVQALQAGHNLHSQVYVATFDVDGDGEDATANEVVIKIYQPSMSPAIPSLRRLYGRPRHWTVLLSCHLVLLG